MIRTQKKHRGFTLIEVLAALGLIAVVLPVVMQGFSIANGLAASAKERTEAAALADSKLNELVATGDWKLGLLSGDFAPERPNFRWKAEIQNWDSSTLQELNVRVYWTARGSEREFIVTTLVDQGQ
ncbi:MAG: type II secretion system protein [Planctomycetota bacterium]